MRIFGLVIVIFSVLGHVICASEISWWKNAVFYQIYPRSFKDSDGDGIGDIQGVISKLDHLSDAGINGLWLSPVFKSPQVDFGYDIADFTQVDPLFGTNEDLIELFTKAHALGIKIILDFVPNHSSNQHDWFLKSIDNDPEFSEFYVWVDSKGDDIDGNPIPPNNWQSVFYGSAWTWNDKRGQFYLHQYDKGQPDLNYRNPKVVQAMKDVLKFWLELGADGFRIDAINKLFEIETLEDEPESGWTTDPLDYAFTHHIHTRDLIETYDMVYQWRELVDQFRVDNGGDEILLMTEAYASLEDTQRYYGDGVRMGAQMPFNFVLVKQLDSSKTAGDFHRIIHSWTDILTSDQIPNWVLGNHDQRRFASHYGEQMVNVLHTLTMTLPGIAVTYNGEEIGMVDNNDITWADTQDPAACNHGEEGFEGRTRDPTRTPFQWDSSAHAGFTDGPTTWLPVQSEWVKRNLQQQIGDPSSVYNYYKKLVQLKKEDPILIHGDFKSTFYGTNVLVISRSHPIYGTYVSVLNMGGISETVNLENFLREYRSSSLVHVVSPQSSHVVGDSLNHNEIVLSPYDSIILKAIKMELSKEDWWRNAVFYQIYPRSFKDSDGNGIGDIPGIISKLDHLTDAGIDGLWLSPIFQSPQNDHGYDISDFTKVDPMFGTDADLVELFVEAKARGIKIILDFVPNHSSDEHEWFQKSLIKDAEYEDYYVWENSLGVDGDGKPIPPNNWNSVFYGSAWEWNDQRQQFYLHQFDKSQPDLNYRNPNVVQAMKDVLTHWLTLGADGFRIDAVGCLFEAVGLPNEEVSGISSDPLDYDFTEHKQTKDQDETYQMVYDWRKLVDDFQAEHGGEERFLMVEAFTNLEYTQKFYGDGDQLGSQMPFNFMLINDLDATKTAETFENIIHSWIDPLRDNEVPNWVLGNHDQKRVATRYGEELVNVLHTLVLTLPGISVTYNGEEIGMVDNNEITWDETQDPQACNREDETDYELYSRDPARTPFQFDATTNAGFTSGPETWLPVHAGYPQRNLQEQLADPKSYYNYYKKLVQLKKTNNVLAYGDFKSTHFGDKILVYSRNHPNYGTLVIVLNLGATPQTINIQDFAPGFAANSQVILAGPQSSHEIGKEVSTNSINVGAFDSVVLKLRAPTVNTEWYKNAVFYQIYPRSFKDSDGDGVGDIRGVIDKLDHIRDAGMKGLWLSPVFKSPQKDFGYDISDFTEVDPIFGTNAELMELFTKAKELEIKIILDFVPNHTSDQHEWFLKSIERDPEFEDYYMWVDKAGDNQDGSPKVPNNWQSVFYGPAWTWNDQRGQFYLHQFDKGQPDLNYHNPKVVQAMKDVLTFWMELGADGFRIDAINHMFEIDTLVDEPISGNTDDPFDYGYTDHIYTKDLDETYDMVYQWRALVDEFQLENGGEERFLMTEAYASLENTQRYYGEGDRLGSHMPFNFLLMRDMVDKSAEVFHNTIHSWIDPLSANQIPNWVLGNHDNPRMATVYGEKMVNVMHTVTMTLPGIAVTYNGEEIGMLDNTEITWEETQDPQACNRDDPLDYIRFSRDPERTPYQWDETDQAGFTSGTKSWLPVHPDYKKLNLKQQKDATNSVFKYYQQLVKIRSHPILAEGDFTSTFYGLKILAYSRTHPTYGKFIILMNLGITDETVDITAFADVDTEMFEVVLASPLSDFSKGNILNGSEIFVSRQDSLILRPKEIVNGVEKDWWEHAIFYQIYPRSFMDSDGDGIGDIQGIISKLDHLKDLGVTATWLSPIFKSPMADFGYDISDFENVDEIFGSNADLEELFTKAKALGIRIILDFVPNHTSDEHNWFLKSVARDPDYENFYIWNDGIVDDEGKRHPPNNWVAVFRGSAWEWNEERGQYYYHQFHVRQPDLNYRNQAVLEAMKNVIKFWLIKGADGFRMDAVNHIMEVENLRNEPRNVDDNDEESYGFVQHHYTLDLKDTYEVIYEFRKFIDEWTAENGQDTRIMMTEAYTNMSSTMLYYESEDGLKQGSHFPFNFGLIGGVNSESNAYDYKNNIEGWLNGMPDGKIGNWVLGNHDQPRFSSRYGSNRVDALNTLSLTLPGVAITYYGDEIGMEDFRDIPWRDTVDPQACNTNDPFNYKWSSRDPERTPMQWDDSDYAGFTTTEGKKPWLPVHPNYKSLNLAKQKTEARSHYSVYKRLVELRAERTMVYGNININPINKRVLAYTRVLENEDTFVVVINIDDSVENVDLSIFSGLPERLAVVSTSSDSNYNIGDVVNSRDFTITKFDALILSSKIDSSSTMIVSSILLLTISTILHVFYNF